MSKPLIGISITERHVSVHFIGKQPLVYVNAFFVRLVETFGGIPLLLPSTTSLEAVDAIVERLDGVLLTSGEDVHPQHYHEELQVCYSDDCNGMGVPSQRPRCIEPNVTRDAFEIALYQRAKQRQLPILGICRGMQIINVAEGGSLHQEIPDTDIKHDLAVNGWMHYHEIDIEPGSRFGRLIGQEKYVMSSVHHQAVNVLGQNLVASARSLDGIIEVIEHQTDHFIMGIQGHPEQTMKNFPLVNNVFSEFVRMADTKKNNLCANEVDAQRKPLVDAQRKSQIDV